MSAGDEKPYRPSDGDGDDGDAELEMLLQEPPHGARARAEPEMHDGMPIRGYVGGEPIPYLSLLPQERWYEVLRPRAEQAPPPQMPVGATPAATLRKDASRQVNFRLGPDEYARLAQAARLFGMKPTVLARVLTIRGVDRALYEERRKP